MTQYYKEKLELGLQYQDFVADILRIEAGIFIGAYSSKKYQCEKGESQCGAEIKYDAVLEKTRNIYLEVAEKSKATNDNWIPSGICRDDNSWLYIIGDYNEIFIFCKHQLRNLVENKERRIQHKMTYKEPPIGTSKGYVYPVEMALKSGSCLRHIIINKEKANV